MKLFESKKLNSILKQTLSLSGCLVLLTSCASIASSKVEMVTRAPSSMPPTFVGCDSPTPLSRTDRLAVIAKISLDAENEIASEVEAPPVGEFPAASTAPSAELQNEKRTQFRDRVGTFAAGSMPDTVPLVSMDRSCWASFFSAQQKLADGDEIGALSDAKEWQDCLTAMFPERIAVAKPYFSCFTSRPNPPKK